MVDSLMVGGASLMMDGLVIIFSSSPAYPPFFCKHRKDMHLLVSDTVTFSPQTFSNQFRHLGGQILPVSVFEIQCGLISSADVLAVFISVCNRYSAQEKQISASRNCYSKLATACTELFLPLIQDSSCIESKRFGLALWESTVLFWNGAIQRTSLRLLLAVFAIETFPSDAKARDSNFLHTSALYMRAYTAVQKVPNYNLFVLAPIPLHSANRTAWLPWQWLWHTDMQASISLLHLLIRSFIGKEC